jgi:outer membrane protein insertion porin family
MKPDVLRSKFGGHHGLAAVLCRRALAFLLVPLVALSGAPLVIAQQAQAQPAQPALDGQPIRSIEWKGAKGLSEETLLYYLGIKVGDPLDTDKLNTNLKALWNRGLIDDISVESTPTGGNAPGVHLAITVKERPVLRSIDYQGLKRLSQTDLKDKIGSRHIHVREGDPVSLGSLQQIKALIEELYGEKGYRFARADYKVEDIGANEKRVTFTVDEGNQVRVADINFEGNTVYSDLHLHWVMKKTKESNLVSHLLKKDVYNPASLQEDLDKVRDLYRSDGYKNVVIGDPKVEVKAENPNAKLVKDQKRRMFITIPIEEGERWRFGDVTIEGNKIFADQLLLRVFPHESGSWLRSKLIDDGVKSLQDLYHNSGYIFAHVEPELVEKGNRVANVVVHVAEGDQYRVGRIEFEGNKRTMDKVLRRELRLQEGRVVSIGAIKNSITKVNQLGYFKLDQEDPVKIDYKSEDKKVDLTFKGEESERTQLEFGGGWSEVDGFFAQFSVSTKNFLGRGEQVGASLQTGRYRKLYDLSYSVPWFMDKPQSLGLRIYRQDLDYTQLTAQEFTRNSHGAVVTYGKQLGLFDQFVLSYNLSKYVDKEAVVGTGADGTPLPASSFSTVINNSSIRPAYIYDSRDNPFEPVRGQKLSIATEYAGGILHGDNYFIRPEIGYTFWHPTLERPSRQVFGFNLEGGWINTFQRHPLSSLERFYLGGENSIRGFSFRSLFAHNADGTPLKDANGFILGGTKYVQANVEYHFLLGGPFRVLVFADAGNVYGERQQVSLSGLRYTAGTELRILLPVFGAPLRFIYAINLKRRPDDTFQNFQFSIGTSF